MPAHCLRLFVQDSFNCFARFVSFAKSAFCGSPNGTLAFEHVALLPFDSLTRELLSFTNNFILDVQFFNFKFDHLFSDRVICSHTFFWLLLRTELSLFLSHFRPASRLSLSLLKRAPVHVSRPTNPFDPTTNFFLSTFAYRQPTTVARVLNLN